MSVFEVANTVSTNHLCKDLHLEVAQIQHYNILQISKQLLNDCPPPKKATYIKTISEYDPGK